MIHDLDIPSAELDEILGGRDRFDIPDNDAGIEIGDRLRLREGDPEARERMEREFVVEVTDLIGHDDGRAEIEVRSVPPEEEGPVS